jgi:hypothetical protein
MENIGFTCKKKIILLLIFTFWKQKMSVTRRCWHCRPVVGRNLYRQYLSRLKGYRFEISATLRQLGWIDAPHTQNFEF